MVVACNQANLGVNAREQQARTEWRGLCFTLEGVQARHVIEEHRDKFALARMYLEFRAEESCAVEAIEASAARGDFRFFIDRGVPATLLSESLARQLLRDWRSAIASKLARIATAFEGKFGEDIDVFAVIPRNSALISKSTCSESCNALSLLNRWFANLVPTA